MNIKQINVKVMEKLTKKEEEILLNNLEKMNDHFRFIVNSYIVIDNHTPTN